MNMIKINCLNLNEHIRTEINKFILNLLNNILTVNIFNKSKYLGQSCTDILGELKTQVNTEEILFKLENIAETCRTETIPQLLNEYEDYLQWVFFYLSYDTYPVYLTQKEISNNFESSIKECHDNFIQIDISMKSFMDVLENQKKKFTQDLDEERAKLLDDITELKTQVNTEEILFKLENIAETCRTETIPQLLNEYEDYLQWVFFYLSYDTYPVYETEKKYQQILKLP